MRNSLIAVTLLLGGGSSITAQTVWPVQGINGSNNLGSVLAQAAPGDILLFQPNTGTFDPFTLTVGVRLIGPATVTWSTPTAGHTVFDIPAGQAARVSEIDFYGVSVPSYQTVLVDGDVTFEDCEFGAGLTTSVIAAPVFRITSGTVLMRNCDVLGATRRGGLSVEGGLCCMTDCRSRGGDAFTIGPHSYPGLSAVEVSGGTLIASNLTAVGGHGNCGLPLFGPLATPAINVRGAGELRLSDSHLTGGDGAVAPSFCQQPGAAAIASSANAVIARTTLVGGFGFPSGPATSGNVQASTQLVGLDLDQGFALGQTSTVTATAGSSQQLLAIVGGFDATPSTLALVAGPVFGAAAQPILLATGAPAAGGTVTHVLSLPNVTGLRYVEVWLQAFQFDGNSVFASPPAGGLIL